MAEGRAVFVLNADLHILPEAVFELESYLFSLEKAVIVGPQGSFLDFRTLKVARYFEKGKFDRPMQTHDVSGFLFCIHLSRYLENRLMFDPRFSPCEYEEWDMGLQVIQAGLACYSVPVTGFDHHWGVSRRGGRKGDQLFRAGHDLKEHHRRKPAQAAGKVVLGHPAALKPMNYARGKRQGIRPATK